MKNYLMGFIPTGFSCYSLNHPLCLFRVIWSTCYFTNQFKPIKKTWL